MASAGLCAAILTILASSFIPASSSHDDRFHEELFIRPLETGHIYSHFQFTTQWNVDPTDTLAFEHFRLFPKSFGEVLSAYHVQELHLSLTQGLWKHGEWGYPIHDAPPGAEIWVWFQEGTRNVDATWMELINVLSGLFCASLNFMDGAATVSPKFSFRPQGVTSERYMHRSGHLLRYSALPRENVCTENLTPWKKLLPCTAKAGLSTLFNAIKLYDSSYHSLSIHYRPICHGANCTVPGVELIQSLAVVSDPMITNGGKQDWSLKKLFGRGLGTSCPLASTSKIYIAAANNKTLKYYFSLTPEPSDTLVVERSRFEKITYAVYDIPQYIASSRVLMVEARYNAPVDHQETQSQPLLHAHRYQTGHGQSVGGVACLLYNHHTEDIIVSYMEMLPWYLRTYFHTLNIQYFKTMSVGENGTVIKPTNINYIPGRERERSYLLELILRLPAESVTKLSIEFERALLKWTEYPPDANHGFYVNSAVIGAVIPANVEDLVLHADSATITSQLSGEATSQFIRIHTESLLIILPTPDFSMPYNVICLACTVIAIAFGSIHNLTTRRFTVLDPKKKKGILTKIKEFIFRKKKSDNNAAAKAEDDKSKDEKEAEKVTDTETKKDK